MTQGSCGTVGSRCVL